MEISNGCIKLQMLFMGSQTMLDLSKHFYVLNQHNVAIVGKGYRRLAVDSLSAAAFDQLKRAITMAVIETERLAIEFYRDNREEIEPLYSAEIDHYDVQADLISYGLYLHDKQSPMAEFDILVDCMDKDDQPIFMYDSRGCCTVRFKVDHLNVLQVVAVS